MEIKMISLSLSLSINTNAKKMLNVINHPCGCLKTMRQMLSVCICRMRPLRINN